MYARNKIEFLHINDALVGVMNEQYNSIKMHGLNNVKKREKGCIYGGKTPLPNPHQTYMQCPHTEPVLTSTWQLLISAKLFFCSLAEYTF